MSALPKLLQEANPQRQSSQPRQMSLDTRPRIKRL